MGKTLIINCSPRLEGDTSALVSEMRKYLEGEAIEISAFRSKIAPCIDCRRCHETAVCVVDDDMKIIYSDDYDNVILASPVYFGTLPGQALNLMSRFQPQHVAAFFLKKPIVLKPKKAGLILVAGGKGNEASAEHHIRVMFMMLNAHGYDKHKAVSLNTDILQAKNDVDALSGAVDLAHWLNKPMTQEEVNDDKREYRLRY